MWYVFDNSLALPFVLKNKSGIGLFTYHKYRKSIDSTVPLDAHGNPIDDGLLGGDEDTHQLYSLVDEERQPLAAAAEPQSAGPIVSLPLNASRK